MALFSFNIHKYCVFYLLQKIIPIDLNDFKTAEELQAVGLEILKNELKSRGMKCGGTLQQRSERLFQCKTKKE